MDDITWTPAPLVALDLEGTEAQDRDADAIPEIAAIPFANGRPALADSCSTLISPGRPVPRRSWISPGLTDAALKDAPALDKSNQTSQPG